MVRYFRYQILCSFNQRIIQKLAVAPYVLPFRYTLVWMTHSVRKRDALSESDVRNEKLAHSVVYFELSECVRTTR